jgi:quercetin dioxygenase-like cupin family protein
MIDPARVAREHYGLDVVATPLPGELDLNFRLDADGERYVLKLHEPRPDLELEDAVLEQLRAEPAVPRLAGPTRAENGRTVRLLSWLDGRPWADERGDLAELGRTVARVDRALADFEQALMHRPHRWDLKNVVSGIDHLPHQVIHNDARGSIAELAFGRHAMIAPHSNPNTTYFVVISGGGFVQVGDERQRVTHGEAVVWPANVVHGAFTDGTEMRAIVVEFAGADDDWAQGVLEGWAAAQLEGGSALPAEGSLAEREIGRDEYDRSSGERGSGS